MEINKKKLNCDQVCWLKNILERYVYVSVLRYPEVSRAKDVALLGALLEIMETLGYEFEDDKAAGNALAHFTEFNKMRGLGEDLLSPHPKEKEEVG